MTEQEALNSPEMKTIMLLSGYVRELSEGADYETTTYKLAETLVKVFSISYVSQQRELLLAFMKDYYKNENWNNVKVNVDKRIDRFLKANNCG